TFVMPAKDVTVTANYLDIGKLVGNVTITGETKFGETLTATVTDSNAKTQFNYKWRRSASNGVVIGSNSPTYQLTVKDIPYHIYCEITTEGKTNSIFGFTLTSIRKADGPAAPTGLGSTAETVAGKKDGTITGVQLGQEYALADGGEWKDVQGTSVINLPAGDYEVRVKETQTHKPGAVAKITIEPGEPVPTYAVTVTGGTGGGNYEVGSMVTITADAPAKGKVFDQWIATGLTDDYELESDPLRFTMPSNDVTLKATYKDAPATTYAVTVNSGTGSGNFAEGETVNITANTADAGKVFDKWTTTDGVAFASANSATTTFVMPAKNVTVTATYKDAPVSTYAVTVNSGTGSGDYSQGDTVTIKANEPEIGKVFDKWTTTDGVTFTDANSATTTFVMPAKAVTVTATYKDAPVTTYVVTVTDGTGSGDYAEGATVNITANAPAAGKVFDKWTTTDGVAFANANSATTTFKMPAKGVVVTATYKDAPVTTYTVTVSNDGNGTGTAKPATAEAGTEITLSASASSGYQFKEWQVVSGGVTISSDKFTMPAGNVEVKAIFEVLPPTLTGVSISPKTTSVQKGTSDTFTAVVTGTGAFDSTVTWSVLGGIPGTNIDNNGKLTVDASETATTLTVTATANGDSSKSDSATVTITDVAITKYAVTVNNGTGGGNFAEGETVSITAGAPADGKVFDKWTTADGVTFTDANSATTTFTMPAKAVTVTATYKDAPATTYAVTVNNGTGGGNFAEGATVSITAATPATDKVFDKWTTSDGVTFANANSVTTTFTMPAKAVTVTATYKDAPATTYAVTVNNGTGGGNFAEG
ncbi:MAG TPA: hypothetical protein VFC74_06805, partial [Oscillospiraceae bacterium]|nr:hypothetical protein [Oscillospiraceae bacterium]